MCECEKKRVKSTESGEVLLCQVGKYLVDKTDRADKK